MEATAPPPKSTAELPITSIPPGQEPFKTSIEYRFQVWQEYEKIVMHFNDLLIRLRTQALGGVAAVAVLAAVIVPGDISPTLRWEVLVGAFAMLLLFWSAVYWLDTLYYNRLLEGAVDAIMDIEDSDKNNAPFPGLQMSTRIENVVATGKPTRPHASQRVHLGRRIFYWIVFGALFIGLGISCFGLKNTVLTSVAEGIVTDGQTGRPVNGARVEIMPPGQNQPVASLTGDAGTFFIVLPSRWQNPLTEMIPSQIPVTVSSMGYRTRTLMVRSSQFEVGTNSLKIEITPGGRDK